MEIPEGVDPEFLRKMLTAVPTPVLAYYYETRYYFVSLLVVVVLVLELELELELVILLLLLLLVVVAAAAVVGDHGLRHPAAPAHESPRQPGHLYIYIYIYRERERYRERDR